jgi:hypothetical protein
MNYNKKENVDLSYLSFLGYFKKDYENLVLKFAGSESIDNNYSQAMQDIFVLSMLNGKKDGLYIEIGANNPIVINNTYLLESQFGWSGFSFEINPNEVSNFNSFRNNKCICADATKFDYKSLFDSNKLPKQIDYLQVDCEPPDTTLECLLKLPLDSYRFSVITFETDLYAGGHNVQIKQEEVLSFYGYKRVVKNIMNGGFAYEDWWVDPLVIPESTWGKFVSENIEFKNVILK